MSSPDHQQQSPPLPVGITLDRGFAMLRRHPRALLLPQLVLNIVPLLFAGVLILVGLVLIGDVATRPELVRESTFLGDSELRTRDVSDYTTGQSVVLGVLIFVGAVVYAWFLIAAFVSVVRGADRALEGKEHLKLRPAMRDALRETPKLFGIGIVFYLLCLVVVFGVVVIVVIGALITPILGVLLGIAAFLFLIWAGIRIFLWPFVHLSEHAGIGSFRRAWAMTKGRFWALFGVLLLVGIVVSVVYFVVSFLLQLIVLGAASLSDEAGVVALIPYVLFSAIFGVVFTAGYIAPLAVAYRTLSGRDTADLWQAAQQMGGGPTSPDATNAGPAPIGRRWDASEEALDDPAPGWAPPAGSGGSSTSAGGSEGEGGSGSSGGLWSGGGSSGSGGAGGLPDPNEPSEAEKRWGRGGDEPPKS